MLRWWRSRKMRWAVRYLASMDVADRQFFKMSRRYERMLDRPIQITVSAASPEERAQAERVEDFMFAMNRALQGEEEK